jgi:hypothetical protein
MRLFLLVLFVAIVILIVIRIHSNTCYDNEITALQVGDTWKISFCSADHVTFVGIVGEGNKYYFNNDITQMYFVVNDQHKVVVTMKAP